MKRALVVIPVDAAGGAEKIAALLATALAARADWQVRFAVLSTDRNSFYSPGLPASIEVIFTGGSGRIGSELRLLKLLRHQYFDLVYASHMRVNTFLSLARSLGILRCNRLVTRESTVLADRFHGLRFLPYRMGYRCYGAQDLIVAQSHSMADSVRNLVPAKARKLIRIVDNPVNLEEIQDLAAVETVATLAAQKTLVWCGRLIEVKRPGVALEVLALLRAAGIDIQLVLIGSGPLQGQLQQAAGAMGLSSDVQFTGHLENPFARFRSADIGIVTSSTEGFPNIIPEMLASGVGRIITTPCVDGLDDLEGVYTVPGFSARELAGACLAHMDSKPDQTLLERQLRENTPRLYAQRILGEATTPEAETHHPLLSICVPSYNRSEQVNALARSVLSQPGDVELCIHIDGSTDDTEARLRELQDDRLRLTVAANKGRARALYSAITRSRGAFVMIFDDDDQLYVHGLRRILADCEALAPADLCGLVYHMETAPGMQLGSSFPGDRSNFLRLRADEDLVGDKKEVLRGDLLRRHVDLLYGESRRVPTSLLWSTVALSHDVACVNAAVGRKAYLDDGMSAHINRLKRASPWPMTRLHFARCRGYFRGRYQSILYMLRSAMACLYYLLLSLKEFLRPAQRSADGG